MATLRVVAGAAPASQPRRRRWLMRRRKFPERGADGRPRQHGHAEDDVLHDPGQWTPAPGDPDSRRGRCPTHPRARGSTGSCTTDGFSAGQRDPGHRSLRGPRHPCPFAGGFPLVSFAHGTTPASGGCGHQLAPFQVRHWLQRLTPTCSPWWKRAGRWWRPDYSGWVRPPLVVPGQHWRVADLMPPSGADTRAGHRIRPTDRSKLHYGKSQGGEAALSVLPAGTRPRPGADPA